MGGAWHTLAHNGGLPGLPSAALGQVAHCRPVGETDSEAAMCLLLERLRPLWQTGVLPDLAQRRQVVADFAADMRSQGPANFIYGDGVALFAHGDRRFQPDGQDVVLVASVPLTPESWTPPAGAAVQARNTAARSSSSSVRAAPNPATCCAARMVMAKNWKSPKAVIGSASGNRAR